MTVDKKRILTNSTTVIATLCHAISFYLPFINSKKGLEIRSSGGEPLSIEPGMAIKTSDLISSSPLFGAIELLAILGLISYLFAIFTCKKKKRETGTGIFIGSLLLALAVTAIMLPTKGFHIINNANQTNFIEFLPKFGYIIWVISLFIGGLAIHLIANLRWQIFSQSK